MKKLKTNMVCYLTLIFEILRKKETITPKFNSQTRIFSFELSHEEWTSVLPGIGSKCLKGNRSNIFAPKIVKFNQNCVFSNTTSNIKLLMRVDPIWESYWYLTCWSIKKAHSEHKKCKNNINRSSEWYKSYQDQC